MKKWQEIYDALGMTAHARGSAYRELVEAGISEEDLARIRTSLQKSRALGGEKFCADITVRLHRDVAPHAPGRPRKRDGEKNAPVPILG